MPCVCRVTAEKARAGRGRRGRTCSRHIRFISKGGPGRATISLPVGATRTNQPGAVPTGLARASALGISQACLRFTSGMVRPRLSYRPRRWAICSGSSVGVSPRAAAMASRVRSSSVGPRPPPRITRSARDNANRMASSTRPRLSPNTVLRCKVTPLSASSRARNAALLSTISPSNSSVPTLIISASSITTSRKYRSKRNEMPVLKEQWQTEGEEDSSSPDECRPGPPSFACLPGLPGPIGCGP